MVFTGILKSAESVVVQAETRAAEAQKLVEAAREIVELARLGEEGKLSEKAHAWRWQRAENALKAAGLPCMSSDFYSWGE